MKLLGIENEILTNHIGDFENVGELQVGECLEKTHKRFRNKVDYEAYINAIDLDYDSGRAIFDGYFYKKHVLHFNLVFRFGYGQSIDFRK